MMHGIHLGRMRLQDARQASARLERYMVRRLGEGKRLEVVREMRLLLRLRGKIEM